MITIRGAFYLLKDAHNPRARPLDFQAGMEALAKATGMRPTRKFQEAATQALLHIAGEVKKTIVREISAGVPARPPLSPITVAKKGHAKWLYETGNFVRGLQPQVLPGGKMTYGYAGVGLVPTGHSRRGASYWVVMQVLTNGAVIRQRNRTIVIPPRRLFPVSLERKTEKQATELLHKFLADGFKMTIHLLSYEPWTKYTGDRILDAILHRAAVGRRGTKVWR